MKKIPQWPATDKLRGKRVLLRLDLNVPLKKTGGVLVVADNTRLLVAMPTLTRLLRAGAKVIILSHLGQPHGKSLQGLSLAPVIKKLNLLLPKDLPKIGFLPTWDFNAVTKVASELKGGEALALQNIRFLPGEERGSAALARRLAKLGNIYTNDAFSVSHRTQVSVSVLPTLLPSFAGERLVREVTALQTVISRPIRPALLILGGAKSHDKIAVMLRLVSKVDKIMLGGVMANIALTQAGLFLGQSQTDEDAPTKEIQKLLRADKLMLPLDVIVSRKNFTGVRHVDWSRGDKIKTHEMIIDIGPITARHYARIVDSAKTVIWNGPLGYIEKSAGQKGSYIVARAVAKATERGAYSVVGGGETIELINEIKLAKHISFISSGGGAMLHYLGGQPLPGITALLSNKR